MKQLTIRGVSEDLARALKQETTRRGVSLNQAVLDILRQSLGLGQSKYDNGLSKFAGKWSQEEFVSFEKNTEVFEQIDQDLWK